jgi:hypothetical protein
MALANRTISRPARERLALVLTGTLENRLMSAVITLIKRIKLLCLTRSKELIKSNNCNRKISNNSNSNMVHSATIWLVMAITEA